MEDNEKTEGLSYKKYLVKITHRVVSSDSVRRSVRLEWLIT